MRWLWMGKLKDEGINQAWRDYYEAQKTAAAGGEQEAAAGATEGAAKKKPPGSLRWDGGRLWVGEREVMKAFSPVRREAILQGFRSFPYIGLGWLVTSLALSSYAATVTAVGEMRDQRLETLEKELRDQVRKTMSKRRGDVPVSPPRTDRARPSPIQHIDTTADADEGANPTNDDGFFGETEAEERIRLMGNSESRRQEQQQQQRQGGLQRSPPNPFQTSDRQGSFQQDRYETQSRRSESSFDDASPTGGAGMMGGDTDIDNDNNSSQSGSAWERIRQNTSPSSSSDRPTNTGGREGGGVGEGGAWDRLQQRNAHGLPPSQQRQQQQRISDRDDTTDSFAFSSSESERNYARDEAQKEFDARVEKERAGGDFGGGDRKW